MASRSQTKIDWITALIWLVMCLIGWATIYSAAYNSAYPSIFSLDMSYGKQLMWIGVSAVLGGIILLTDVNLIRNASIPIYATITLMLVLVLLVGVEKGGAKSWFGVGSFGIQPSEFSKVAIALFLAHYLGTGKEPLKSLESRVIALGILALPAGLIMLQPDTGTVLILFAFILVMYREGLSGTPLVLGISAIIIAVMSIIVNSGTYSLPFSNIEFSGQTLLISIFLVLGIVAFFIVKRLALPRFRKKYLRLSVVITLAILGFISSVNFIINDVLKPYQRNRVYILLQLPVDDDPWADWNIKNSKTAIGNGGLLGQGYLEGPITKFRFVPEQNTDFIFCTIGEEWGYFGSLVVLFLFTFLIIRLIIMAERQRSVFSRIFGYSVACILFMHVFINIGMVIGLAPVIGIPLPFFSYGGSSMMAFTVMLFIFIKLDSERMVVLR
ncbi:MAG: rod shape-determining protein RodA [Flavobacteriales bacterium]